jgi:hypothetical protein
MPFKLLNSVPIVLKHSKDSIVRNNKISEVFLGLYIRAWSARNLINNIKEILEECYQYIKFDFIVTFFDCFLGTEA